MKNYNTKNSIKIIISIMVAIFLLNLSNIANASNVPIIINEHITQTHTKEQIAGKYRELSPKYSYSNNIFAVKPIFTGAPYVAGKLQDTVETDTVNQINYFRWLYGISDVTIHTQRQDGNQKGAVVLARLSQGKDKPVIKHDPEKPEDMDQAFYEDAKVGCDSGYIYENIDGQSRPVLFNANIAWGEISSTHSIENFISDLYNVTPNSWIGHRLNLLELEAKKASFGYCNKFTTLSIYYQPYAQNYKPSEKFYAYPSAGYFPTQNFTTNEYWSFMPTEKVNFDNLKIEVTYKGKVYNVTPTGIEGNEEDSGRIYPAIVFKLPDEIITDLGGTREIMPETKIDVVISGLTNSVGRPLIYEYQVNFFDINTSTSKYMIGDTDGNKRIATKDAKMVLQHIVKKIKLTEDEFKRADTDGNGKITTKDAKLILQYIVKKINKFPAEE